MNFSSIKTILISVLRSYSQVFFSDNYIFAIPLLLISIVDFSAGICGIVAVLSANIAAYLLKFDKYSLESGLYGFNALLVGMGIGYFYKISLAIIIISIISGFLTLLVTILIYGILSKYYLPYLSLPFILCIWIIISATYQLTSPEYNTSGLYVLNKIYKIGGIEFVKIHEQISNFIQSNYITNYFTSLGALYFQPNVISGFFVAIALLFYSRIAFILSFIGYSVAYLTYYLIGMDLNLLGYSYIGLNFILGAIALGGYFYIPNKDSFIWAILITPVIALVTAGTNGILKQAGLPIFSLPFNLVVISFLYSFRFRTQFHELKEVTIQKGSPEKNLYAYQSFVNRFPNYGWLKIKLPFLGEWMVSQAHNGEYTHKGEWAYAWDFILVDNENKQFKNNGDFLADYYCYGQNVIAPADGIVVTVEDGIEDNIVGSINIAKNWGNSIIIKHSDGLYSKFSHLKKDSITVKVGDYVQYGKVIAKVGNSGRSPYPHLHFQFQAEPYIGAKTIKYPFFAFKENSNTIKTFDYPVKNTKISPIIPEQNLQSHFNFIPGVNIKWNIKQHGISKFEEWEIHNTPYNELYIYCQTTKSILYFINDGIFFSCLHFEGNYNSLLYKFYQAAFRLPLIIVGDNIYYDNLPINKIFSGWRLFIHDIVAPFFFYLKVNYEVKLSIIGSDFDIDGYEYSSNIVAISFEKEIFTRKFKLIANNNTLKLLDLNSNLEAICEPY